ncbi:MAG: hypothetical protein WCF85_11605 [Rhodospirillaceae bacterium]
MLDSDRGILQLWSAYRAAAHAHRKAMAEPEASDVSIHASAHFSASATAAPGHE